MRFFYIALALFVATQEGGANQDFYARVHADGQAEFGLSKLSPSSVALLDRVAARMEHLGRLPNYIEFLEELETPDIVLSQNDRLYLFWVFGCIQRPQIDKGQLAELVLAQRALLDDCKLRFKRSSIVDPFTSLPHVRKIPQVVEYTYWSKGESVKLESRAIDEAVEGERHVRSFDGQALRQVQSRNGSMDFATVAKLENRKDFFPDGHPMLVLLLCPSNDRNDMGNDLAKFATSLFVYETPVEVDGFSCIVVGNEDRQVFCSINHGYAVVRTQSGPLMFDDDAGRYIRGNSYATVRNSDFHRVNDILWLPSISEFEHVRNGVIYHKWTSELLEVAVPDNDTSQDDFSRIIPKDAYVADAVQNVSYIANSEKLSAQLQVSNPIDKQRWYLLILANVVSAAALLWIVYYLRCRNRGTSSDVADQ